MANATTLIRQCMTGRGVDRRAVGIYRG